MAQDLSIEYPDDVVFISIRTISSRLWFIQNRRLQRHILAFLAKNQERYGVIIYGFIIMGNHYHLLARFPRSNRAAFLQAFNSVIPKLVSRHVPRFTDGKLWARRARVQVVPTNTDIFDYFCYLVFNPIASGLCQSLSDFDGYSSFADSARCAKRRFKLINWSEYRNRVRFNPRLKPRDFEQTYTLTFSRLPGYEELNEDEYRSKLTELALRKREEIIESRKSSGQGFATKKSIKKFRVGDKPTHSKMSTRDSKRPLVLTKCMQTKRAFLDSYFCILEAYRSASRKYRAGDFTVLFPPGTYRPVVAA